METSKALPEYVIHLTSTLPLTLILLSLLHLPLNRSATALYTAENLLPQQHLHANETLMMAYITPHITTSKTKFTKTKGENGEQEIKWCKGKSYDGHQNTYIYFLFFGFVEKSLNMSIRILNVTVHI